jgi:hypothetical protein
MRHTSYVDIAVSRFSRRFIYNVLFSDTGLEQQTDDDILGCVCAADHGFVSVCSRKRVDDHS